MLQRNKAEFKANSYDAATNTVDVVWATATPVPRRDANGIYDEVLSLNPAHVDLSRIEGASVLNSHSQSSMSDIVGVVQAASVRDGMGIATVKLSTRPDVAPYIEDIKNGIIRFLSVGYSVTQFAESKNALGKRTKTATLWQPFELSFVPVPADPNSKVRKDSNMEIQTETIKPITPDVGVIAHRAAVRDIAKRSGMDSIWADSQIDSGNEIASIKALAHDAMMSRSQTITVRQVGASNDDPAIVLQRRIDGLFCHTTGATPKPEARAYSNDTFSDHVRSMLNEQGISTRGMSKIEIFNRAAMNTTTDFSALLTGVGNRSLLPAYEAAVSPLKKLFAKQSRNDFRAAHSLRISEMSALSKVTESGEIKSVGRSELDTSYLMDTYAGIFTLSRKAMINDDLGAFTDSSRAFGQAAATTEALLMIALLESNPVMQEDSVALFNSAHGNLATTPSVIDLTNLSIARKALRDMKGMDSKTAIAVTPRYLVVSSDQETTGEQALAVIQPTKVADVNPMGGKLELLVDPRLASKKWYLAGDPSQIACLSYAVLGGAEAPTVEIQNLFDTLGTSVRCYHDFGVGAQDWRGLFKNVGV